MNRPTTLNGRARRGRWRVWLPHLTLAVLAAVGVSDGGLSDRHPELELASTTTATPYGWLERPPLEVARIGLDVAPISGEILAVGGFNPERDGVFASAEAQRVAGNQPWHSVAAMPTARANAAAAELGGMVYVAGGFTDEQTLAAVERYDPRTGSWSAVTPLPAPRGAAGAAALGGLLYVAGGAIPINPKEDEITASVLAFNPRTRRWVAVAPMPTARWRLRLVAAGGHLYAIGGQSAAGTTLSTVERFDPATNTWTTVAPMNSDRGVPGAVAVTRGSTSLIVVVGGCQFVDGQRVALLRSTEVFNVTTGQWRLLDPLLPQGRCSLGSAVKDDGSVLAIGGAVEVDAAVAATAEVHALPLTIS